MEIPDVLEVTISDIAQGGDGVGRIDGMVVFVPGALPGERLWVNITEQRPNYVRGTPVEFIITSPDRVAPRMEPGDHVPWQHIAYPAQLRLKERIVRGQLGKLAGLAAPTLEPPISSSAVWGYRNSARLHVADDGRIGYRYAASHQIYDLTQDPLLLPVLNEALAGLRVVLAAHPAARAQVASVVLRASMAYGYCIAALHMREEAELSDVAPLVEDWRVQTHALAGVVAAGRPLSGVDSLHEALGSVVFDLGPESFFQVNAFQAEALLEVVRTAVDPQPGEHLLDLYSGAGTFALPLAASVAKVTAIEEHPGAVADGRHSAVLNDIANVQFIRGTVERVLPVREDRYDAAILDPPRRGCHPAVIEALIDLAIPRLVYISCHPGILGRDLKLLLAAGYRVAQIQPIDLFPQTPHIETVVTLQK
jgi:23S rRNA (uracil1939-C5)-methyltransferase